MHKLMAQKASGARHRYATRFAGHRSRRRRISARWQLKNAYENKAPLTFSTDADY